MLWSLALMLLACFPRLAFAEYAKRSGCVDKLHKVMEVSPDSLRIEFYSTFERDFLSRKVSSSILLSSKSFLGFSKGVTCKVVSHSIFLSHFILSKKKRKRRRKNTTKNLTNNQRIPNVNQSNHTHTHIVKRGSEIGRKNFKFIK